MRGREKSRTSVEEIHKASVNYFKSFFPELLMIMAYRTQKNRTQVSQKVRILNEMNEKRILKTRGPQTTAHIPDTAPDAFWNCSQVY